MKESQVRAFKKYRKETRQINILFSKRDLPLLEKLEAAAEKEGILETAYIKKVLRESLGEKEY